MPIHEHSVHDHDHVQDHDHAQEHDHAHAHDFRAASRKALITAGILLSVIFVIELIGGILSRSLALLADAAHLLTDIAAIMLALLAQWYGARPSSAQKSFGFRRVEILAALINGLSLWGISGYIVYEAIHRLQNPPEVSTIPMVIIASFGLIVQLIAALILLRASGESLNVKGAYVHAATDAVQSAGVVITGIMMIFTGWWILDPIVSLAIAVLISWSGGKIVWEATHILMEGTPSDLDLQQIVNSLQDVSGVSRVTDIHAWSITTGFNALSAHVETDPCFSAEQRETLRKQLSEQLKRDFPLQHITLQVEGKCCEYQHQQCSQWLSDGG
jgi:cobalt-zinc-cadmium efflux system protein